MQNRGDGGRQREQPSMYNLVKHSLANVLTGGPGTAPLVDPSGYIYVTVNSCLLRAYMYYVMLISISYYET